MEKTMTFEPNAAAAGAQRQAPTIRNFDRPEVAETFADAITSLVFDGQSLRIEFGVTRSTKSSPTRRSPGAAIPLAVWCCRRPPLSISSTGCSRSARR
jgi:hypothetical protein